MHSTNVHLTLTLSVAAGFLTGFASPASADVRPHAGMMRMPDVSQTQIVFSYANDLWLVPRAGGVAVPLSSPEGGEAFPRFSEDGKTIAFVGNYDGNNDLYTLSIDGGVPFRVTHHPGTETLCNWTPDGELLFSTASMSAFSRSKQLFTVPADGGLPQKLPVPYGDMGAVSPDGKWLAYTPHSREGRSWKRYRGGMATDIWLFHLEDHSWKSITDWEGTDGVPMWHGDSIYYLSDAGPELRLNIWAYETGRGEHEQITHFEDYDVAWPAIGPGDKGRGEIVFQNGSDLYLLDLGSKKAKVVDIFIPGDRPKLRPQTIDVKNRIARAGISSTGKRVVLAARGDIWTVPAKKGSPRNLTRTDGVAERSPAWSPDKRWIAYFSDATGEYELYITQSDGKGETRQLTDNGQTFRYSPIWSPDSKHIVFTDNTASIYLHTIESGGTMLVDQDPSAGGMSVNWSHDSGWLAYTKGCDNLQRAVWLYCLATDETHQVTRGMFNDYSPTFDRKGKYLYYSSQRVFKSPIYEDVGSSFVYTGAEVVLAVPLKVDAEYPWAPESDEETWEDEEEDDEANGKDEDAEDKKDGGEDPPDEDETEEGDDDQGAKEENADDNDDDSEEDAVDDGVTGLWEGVVKGGEPLPEEGIPFTLTLRLNDGSISGSLSAGPYAGELIDASYDQATGEINGNLEIDTGEGMETFVLIAKIEGESISGAITSEGFAGSFTGTRTSRDVPEEEKDEEEEEVEKVEIDLEGFEQRALLLPIKRGRIGRLAVNNKNQLIYGSFGLRGSGKPAEIKLFDIDDEKREAKTVVSGAGGFDISADGKKLLVRTGGNFAIIDSKPGQKLDKKIPLKGMRKTIEDPRVEWRQIFTDAWRIQRDFFYVANMHGLDWPAVRDHYIKMIDDCVTRDDVTIVIREMIAELNVGHAYYFGGSSESPPRVSVGMLGCDFELDQGAYRISRIYEGGPWDSDARGPLSRTGVDIKVGDYLLAVDGLPIDVSKDPWAAFQGLADRDTTLTVNEKPLIDDDAREVRIKLMGGDGGLRFRAWIEQNRAYVEQQSDGKVGYIFVPDTGIRGQNELFRQFYGQRDKAALIIDERWNGGGQLPHRFIELLNRPVLNYWARRYGKDTSTPNDAHHGPKCMLINGLAGSGGDCFPFYFRRVGLGKLIGTRTWGGLVGISGNPGLIDGGHVTVPRFAFYETDGTWGIEGHGVDPDIVVLDDPSKMVDGGDPQLDAAIEHMLEEIELHPYKPVPHPPAPDRTGIGIREEDK